VQGNKAVITLDTFGSSLQTFDVKEVRGVAICGEDKKWVWADAQISSGNQITASSPKVAKPVAVRYAWANNPVCNLYNKEWMPVTPFRSDSFEMTTKRK
jgi:sialate O-acetylesterase